MAMGNVSKGSTVAFFRLRDGVDRSGILRFPRPRPSVVLVAFVVVVVPTGVLVVVIDVLVVVVDSFELGSVTVATADFPPRRPRPLDLPPPLIDANSVEASCSASDMGKNR